MRNFKKGVPLLVLSFYYSVCCVSAAENEDKKDSTQNDKPVIQETVLGMNVSGNKELPNVLYIVPWKSDATPAPLPQVTRLVDEIYAPVDPEVFNKQVKFYYQLTDKKEAVNEKEDD